MLPSWHILFKRWAIHGLFFFIFVFSIQLTVNIQWFYLSMTGFELRTSGAGSDHSTNWATTTYSYVSNWIFRAVEFQQNVQEGEIQSILAHCECNRNDRVVYLPQCSAREQIQNRLQRSPVVENWKKNLTFNSSLSLSLSLSSIYFQFRSFLLYLDRSQWMCMSKVR